MVGPIWLEKCRVVIAWGQIVHSGNNRTGAMGNIQQADRTFSRDNLGKARLLIVCAMAAFSIQDVFVKLIVADMSVWQMQFLRSVGCMTLLVVVAALRGQAGTVIPTQWVWPFVRAVFMCLAYIFFYISLPYLSLSQASATFFIGPLLITVLAALFLGEKIGWRRAGAVFCGFIGVLFIVQPWHSAFSIVALFPALAAASYAMGVITTRWRCRADPAFSLSMMHNFFYALVGAEVVLLLGLFPASPQAVAAWPALLSQWTPMSLAATGFIVAVAITHTVGSTVSVRSYQLADASKIAPLEYTYLAFAPVWDMTIWHNPPSAATVAGILLIAGAGIIVSWREGRPARPKPQNYGETPWVATRKLDKNLFGTRIQIGFKLSRSKPPA